MRKFKSNKGFSLVELMFAVAILSILLTPIMTSLAQALKQSTDAQERQYMYDNASYVLDYFKKTPKDVLDKGGDSELAINTPVTTTDCTVNIWSYSVSGNSITTNKISATPIAYTIYNYTLRDLEVGPRKTKIDRKISMSNMDDKIKSVGYSKNGKITYYTVVYDMRRDYQTAFKSNGWSVTDDGRIVKYAAGSGIITDVIVSPVQYGSIYYNIQNLDTNTVAIIDGSTSDIDGDFNKDLRNTIRKIETSYLEADAKARDVAFDAEAVNDEINQKINEYLTASDYDPQRLISISIKTVMKGSEVDHYTVVCTVNYKCSKKYRNIQPDGLSYTVFQKDFFTTEAPDVYLIYEPYVKASLSGNSKNYATNDYIVTYGDVRATNKKYGDPSKVYIIKPTVTRTGMSDYTSTKIHINQVYDSADSIGTDMEEQLKVFTNLSLAHSGANYTQFDFSALTATNIPDLKLSSYGGAVSLKKYETTNIKGIEEDQSDKARLYNIEVNFRMLSGKGESCIYYGAKEAN